MIISLKTLEDSKTIAYSLAESLQLKDCICFYGDLGAGKTSFIRFLVEALYLKYGYEPVTVTSPTFSLLHLYEKDPLYIAHFDLYRLKNSAEVEAIGFDEYIEDYLCLIEWAQRASEYLPENRLELYFSYKQEERFLEIKPVGHYKNKNPFLKNIS